MLSDIEQIADFEETLRLAMEGQQAEIWTCLPGIVESAKPHLDPPTVTVQPAIMSKVEGPDGVVRNVVLPLLPDVPVGFFSTKAGGLTLPIGKGDEVIVIFSCRCIDAFWQSGEVSVQLDVRMHDLSDAIAIPARLSQAKKLKNISATNIQLRNDSGDTMLEIEPSGKVQVVASNEVSLSAPTIAIEGKSSVSISAPSASISGTNVSVSGTNVAVSGILTINGTPYLGHIHAGGTVAPTMTTGPVVV